MPASMKCTGRYIWRQVSPTYGLPTGTKLGPKVHAAARARVFSLRGVFSLILLFTFQIALKKSVWKR